MLLAILLPFSKNSYLSIFISLWLASWLKAKVLLTDNYITATPAFPNHSKTWVACTAHCELHCTKMAPQSLGQQADSSHCTCCSHFLNLCLLFFYFFNAINIDTANIITDIMITMTSSKSLWQYNKIKKSF